MSGMELTGKAGRFA